MSRSGRIFVTTTTIYLLLEGLILERVTGVHVAEYLQEKIWKPLGMEYPASWSLDDEQDGFEKTGTSFNARAIDFARFGLLYLQKGKWNGKQIISEKWVADSTTPDPSDRGKCMHSGLSSGGTTNTMVGAKKS